MNELRRGQRVTSREGVRHRRHLLGWPGWGAENWRDFLGEIPAGLHGTITDVAQHGSAPYTRYSVRFDDGTSAHELVLGRDFNLIVSGT